MKVGTYMINTIIDIAAVASCAITLITLITLTVKPLRERFANWIKVKSNSSELENKIDELSAMLKSHIDNDNAKLLSAEMQSEATLCILRDRITTMYYKYTASESILAYAREDLVKLYNSYHAMHGNSYVDIIYEEMLELPVEK